MSRPFRFILFSLGLTLLTSAAQAQYLTCNTTAVPPVVRGEGITERIGDIVLNCAGGNPGATITGNLTIFLNTNITNRVTTGNTVTDIVFTTDTGSGPVPIAASDVITGPNTLVYNGLSFTLSATGTAVLRIANIRSDAIQLMLEPNAPIQASLSFNGGLLSLTSSMLTVAYVERGLYAGMSATLLCAQSGSPLPSTLSFSNLLSDGSYFASTRLTEGFAGAFSPRSAPANLDTDTGTRFVITYSGFPAGAQLYVPTVVAGSDAVQPTGGGDFGVPPSGGQYAPSTTGSLLLSLVANTDARGAGGTLSYGPGAVGSGTVSFDQVSALTLTNGTGIAVYEVVDSNPNAVESAQFPTFLGLAPNVVNAPTTTNETVTFGPTSTVYTASTTEPLPRFVAVAPPNDCSIVGDCSANYYPRLYLNTTPVNIMAQAGSPYQIAYAQVQNQGSGLLEWSAAITYTSGTGGWLTATPNSGLNNGTIRLDATPGTLAPGTYQATVTVSAGAVAGSQTIPVTMVITAAQAPAVMPPVITSVVNAASLSSGPIAPGSLATIQGSMFSGNNLAVTVNGVAAQVLFANAQQINFLVPASINQNQAPVVVTVNGVASSPQTVNLASIAPAIFSGAVLNQDSSVNGSNNPAPTGTVIQIFATGLSGAGTITAQINNEVISQPYYAGPAPGLMGVQQVDVVIPSDLPSMTTNVYVCGATFLQSVCSPPAPLTIVNQGQ